MQKERENPIYYKGLNGLRAIAALLVIMAHSWDEMGKFLPIFNDAPVGMGNLAVTIFFTLSGFLITSLLFLEQEKKGNIDIGSFYVRRILRIWPLYYWYILLCIVVFFFLQQDNLLQSSLWFYILFAANIPYMFDKGLNGINHLWSISVEEQFYLFWPLFFKIHKNITKRISIFLLAYIGLKIIGWLVFKYAEWPYLHNALRVFRFDCMAIGGLAALFFHQQKTIINFLSTKVAQLLAISIMLLMMIFEFRISSAIDHLIIALCTVVLIISNIVHQKPLINLENKTLIFFAKISYGLYVYHILVLTLLAVIVPKLVTDPLYQALLIGFCTFIFSTIIAYVSYRFLEQPFLRFKSRFQKVKSNANPI